MALKLVPPGERGNKNYLARGRIHGRLYEYSLQTTDGRVARRNLREFEERVRDEGPRAAGTVTFADAANRYMDYKRPSRENRRDIERIVAEIGRRRLRDLTPADLHDLANKLKPNASGAWKNRHVLTPAATIWHHAADTGLCTHVKIKKFPEAKPRTRALSREDASKLIAATEENTDKRLLLLWLFHQGMRITHTLNVDWRQIDMDRATVTHRERKGHQEHDYVFPLHPEVMDELRRIPQHRRYGQVFKLWAGKTSVYYWLRPLCEGLGIEFTPHMARHSKGTWLNDEGAGLRTIMEALGHASERSSLRYQHGNVEVVRAVGERISLRREKA